MTAPRIAVLVLAVLAAAAAAWLASTLVGGEGGRREVEAPPRIETEDVLVAARDIAVGTRLGARDLRWQAWPREAVTPALVTRSRKPDAIKEYAGALARTALVAGEPVTPAKLVTNASAGFMAARLAPGMRAVSVAISPVTGAGGFILPGDRVDVILTRESNDDTGRGRDYTAQTILTNVRVLAIDQAIGEGAGDKTVLGKTATLELTPRQAELLARAQAMGEIVLTLRSVDDAATGGPAATGALDDTGTASRRAVPRGGTVTVVRYGVVSRESPRSGR